MDCSSVFCLTFAGAPGSSKTPIANFLSCQLNLPVFNNHAIRKEVLEDQAVWNEPQILEYEKPRDRRLEAVLKNHLSFIYDASMDRNWDNLKPRLIRKNYTWFIISLDLSRELLLKFYPALRAFDFRTKKILKNHNAEIGLHLTDQDFSSRLNISLESVTSWLKTKNLKR